LIKGKEEKEGGPSRRSSMMVVGSLASLYAPSGADLLSHIVVEDEYNLMRCKNESRKRSKGCRTVKTVEPKNAVARLCSRSSTSSLAVKSPRYHNEINKEKIIWQRKGNMNGLRGMRAFRLSEGKVLRGFPSHSLVSPQRPHGAAILPRGDHLLFIHPVGVVRFPPHRL